MPGFGQRILFERGKGLFCRRNAEIALVDQFNRITRKQVRQAV
jgi:hypothetical protein